MEVKKFIIVDYVKLPNNLKAIVKEMHRFQNDCLLRFHSEINFSKGPEDIDEYWKDQVATNIFEGTKEEFIEKYNLQIEEWIFKQNIDFEGVEEVLIDICW